MRQSTPPTVQRCGARTPTRVAAPITSRRYRRPTRRSGTRRGGAQHAAVRRLRRRTAPAARHGDPPRDLRWRSCSRRPDASRMRHGRSPAWRLGRAPAPKRSRRTASARCCGTPERSCVARPIRAHESSGACSIVERAIAYRRSNGRTRAGAATVSGRPCGPAATAPLPSCSRTISSGPAASRTATMRSTAGALKSEVSVSHPVVEAELRPAHSAIRRHAAAPRCARRATAAGAGARRR